MQTYDNIESTNLIIKEALARGCAEGLVVTALVQGGGYGRQGRLWESPLGGLYASFALRPFDNKRSTVITQKQAPTLSLVVALALRQTLQTLGVPGVQIKWPNDVLIDGAKVCGISLEGILGGICVGVGINVFPSSEPLTYSLPYNVAYVGPLLARIAQKPQKEACINCGNPEKQTLSLFQVEVLEHLLITFFMTFTPLYDAWLIQGFSALCEEYNGHLFNRGDSIALETITNHTLIEGIVEGVDNEGRLLLKQRDGRVVPAASGEVHTLHKS